MPKPAMPNALFTILVIMPTGLHNYMHTGWHPCWTQILRHYWTNAVTLIVR